ncbi:hypothetical protein G7054_g11743 [Neopestalotiopsis clavispora]|nr:hypothetical protein G7054_g11743 [Neopestalotiopsis clavispora]
MADQHYEARPFIREATPGDDDLGSIDLLVAVEENNINLVRTMLDMPDYETLLHETRDEVGRTALHSAVMKGHCKIAFDIASKCGSVVDEKDNFDRTALFYAVAHQQFPDVLVGMLLLCGAEVNHIDVENKTPLLLAIEKKEDALIRQLEEFDSITMHTMIAECDLRNGYNETMVTMLDFFLAHGNKDQQNFKNHKGQSIFHASTSTGNLAVIDVLRKHSMFDLSRVMEDVDDEGNTPLISAARAGWFEMTRHLVETYHFDLSVCDANGMTVLHWAARQGHMSIVSLLAKANADIMALTKTGFTPLLLACDNRQDRTGVLLLEIATIERALESRNAIGLGLTRIAAQNDCIEVLTELIKYAKKDGSDASILSEQLGGCSHAFAAIDRNCHQSAMALLKAGAIVTGYNRNRDTALHCAVTHGDSEIVQWLLEHMIEAGSWIASKNNYGQTPADVAVTSLQGSVLADVLAKLSTYGNPEPARQMNTEGWMGIHWATLYGRLDLIKSLVRKKKDGTRESVLVADSKGRKAEDLARSLYPEQADLLQWLTPVATLRKPEDTPLLLAEPEISDDVEDACSKVQVSIMDVYQFTAREMPQCYIPDILRYGPGPIMSVEADKFGMDQDLIQRIYFDIESESLDILKGVGDDFITDQERDETMDAMSDARKKRVQFEKLLAGLSPDGLHTDSKVKSTARKISSVLTPLKKVIDNVSTQHSKLSRFIDEKMRAKSGTAYSRPIAPFIDFFQTDSQILGTGMYQPPAIRGFRICIAMPYLTFTRESKQKQYPQVVHHYNQNHGGALQVPQTLDQFHYQSLLDSDRKVEEQVIYRHQKTTTPQDDPFVCMVDQLWLHIADDATVVTSSSQHLDDEAINLATCTKEQYMGVDYNSSRVNSVYSLIALILATCIRKSIEKELGSKKERTLDMFAAAVTDTSRRQVRLFGEFRNSISKNSQRRIRAGINLTKEINLLEEVNDIFDELMIIKKVLDHQKYIFEAYFKIMHDEANKKVRLYGNKKEAREATVISDTVSTYKILSRVDVYIEEVIKMASVTKETQRNLKDHLDLRQRDANLNEAAYARQAADDTTRQSRTIMVFTVVTIFFLPISFLSSLFALDIDIFPHNDDGDLKYSPGWAFSWLFGMTIAVSLPLVLLAFYVNEVASFWTGKEPQQGQENGGGIEKHPKPWFKRIAHHRRKVGEQVFHETNMGRSTGAKEFV